MSDQLKDIKQPFGVYDVFGYILPGFFFFALVVLDFDGAKLLRYFIEHNTVVGATVIEGADYKLKHFLNFIYFDSKSGFGIIPFLVFLIFCYLGGHIMASFSSFLSKHLVRRFLKFPSENLFPDHVNTETRSKVYRGVRKAYRKLLDISNGISSLNYKKPLDNQFQKEFKLTIDKVFGYEVSRKDYYWLTYSNICTIRPDLVRRIQHFVNLAGFARNVTGAFTLYILIRVFVFWWFLDCALDIPVLIILGGFGLVMLTMYWTYLRLHKRQAVDMFYIFMSIYRQKDKKDSL